MMINIKPTHLSTINIRYSIDDFIYKLGWIRNMHKCCFKPNLQYLTSETVSLSIIANIIYIICIGIDGLKKHCISFFRFQNCCFHYYFYHHKHYIHAADIIICLSFPSYTQPWHQAVHISAVLQFIIVWRRSQQPNRCLPVVVPVHCRHVIQERQACEGGYLASLSATVVTLHLTRCHTEHTADQAPNNQHQQVCREISKY